MRCRVRLGFPGQVLWVVLAGVFSLVLPASARGLGVPALFVPTATAETSIRREGVTRRVEAGASPGEWKLNPEITASPASWRPGDRWALPDSTNDSRGTVLVVEAVRRTGPEGVVVRGHLEGDPGSEVRMCFVGSASAATWQRGPGGTSRLLPLGEGRHRLIHSGLGVGEGPRCANGGEFVEALAKQLADLPSRARLTGSAPETNTLEIAFFYTPAAAAGAGGASGMHALLDLALEEANDAFGRSGAGLQIRSACRWPVSYVESGDLSLDLDRLLRSGDGPLDEAQRLREVHAGDVVCLITEFEDSNQYAGMAQQLRGTDKASLERGFLVCLRPYLIGNYTLPHELGHVLGCNHDRENSGGSGLHTWSYGNRITVDGQLYRTIMAYRPGIQMPLFSSPNVLFRGVPTGVAAGAGAADNVRTLNLTRALVAGVREPESRVGWAVNWLAVREDQGRVKVELQRSGTALSSVLRVRTLPGSALPGRDYESLDEFITWPAGQPTAAVELRLLASPQPDPVRRFDLVLSDPSAGVALGPNAVVSVAISDPATDAAVPLDTSVRARLGADYLVAALIADGRPEGGWYAGGGFASFDGHPHARLARVRSDGSADPAFQPRVKYRVNALALRSDGRLVLGGEFNTVNDERRNHVAVLNSDGSLDPDFRFDPGADFDVAAVLALPEAKVLIAGSFTNVQGAPASRVARLLPSGELDPLFDSRVGPDGVVLALAALGVDAGDRDAGSGYYVGGGFQKVGEARRVGIARLTVDGKLDAGFGSSEASGPDGPVLALARDGHGGVLAAGEFVRFDGRRAGRFVRLTDRGVVDEEFLAGTGLGADGPVRSILVAADQTIWLGGSFATFDGQPRRAVARLRPDGRLDVGFDPQGGPDDGVYALAPAPESGVVFGGGFRSVNGIPRGGIAAYLAGPPVAPWFLELAATNGLLRFESAVARGQAYELDRSVDLEHWLPPTGGDGILRAGPGAQRVSGKAVLPESGAGFLRLRRRLE